MNGKPTLEDILELVRAYCAAVLPGDVPGDLTISFLASGREIRHPIPVQPSAPGRPVRPGLAPARHSIDFRSVHWFGADYTFTAGQAACIKVLWEGWEQGTPEISQAAVLEAAGSTSESLRTVFQGSPAWRDLVVQGQKGAYRLAEPGDASAPEEAES